MPNHLLRIREHFRVETEALRLKGDGARILDHMGSRGADAENSLLQWLQARLAPDFTVSSGEVIDSFNTDTGGPSRQQDGIIHRNDRNANRFMLPVVCALFQSRALLASLRSN
ncbi:MAG: DUF6602 domain-containing protein [Hyalangium sp.]|uniref:DUF6602 domain-containing protein n=1 Tax=Hyalangium sp. TaxID=2028555 RepID=UPI00389A601E